MNPTDPVLQFWRGILGEVPEADKFGRFASLNDLPPTVIVAARRLGKVRSAVGFISSYLEPTRRMHVEQFVQEVVFGDLAPEAWLRGRTLVPDWSLREQLTLPRHALCEPVGGAFSHRIVPSLSDWQTCTSWVGAPCLEQPDADYLRPVPARTAALREARTELVTHPTVALRRWIAARIAMVSNSRLGTDFSEAESIASSLVPLPLWTTDARAALRGLEHEARQLGPALEAAPGFRGADSWFLEPGGDAE